MHWNRETVYLSNAESPRQHLLIPENLFMALTAAFYMENCIFKMSTYNLITEKRESRDILDTLSQLLLLADFSLCQGLL